MKVLVISHTPFNKSESNGRTLAELFCDMDENNIAQIYYRTDMPDLDMCDNYYLISDLDVFKSVISRQKPGHVLDKNHLHMNKTEKKLYHQGSKRKSYSIFARNFMWSFNTWFTDDLKKWLNNFEPDIIFCYVGDYIFSMRVAMKISEYLQVPMVNYIVDDFYLNDALSKGVFGHVNSLLYSKYLTKCLTGRTNICLTEMMASAYVKCFDGKFETLYTSSSIKRFKEKEISSRIKMSYLGTLFFDRYKSLLDIGKVIYENKLPIDFEVYSGEERKWVLEPFRKAKGIIFKGKIDYTEVLNVMENSDILVHVEDFSKENIDSVKYSFSTKIADSLSCGRCLLAYGPENIASIDYLSKNKCALVATSYEELEKMLYNIVDDRNLIYQPISKALEMSEKNHRDTINQIRLKTILKHSMDDC